MFRVLWSLNKVHHWFFPRFEFKNSIAQYCPLLEYCPARDFLGFPGRVIPGRVFHLNPGVLGAGTHGPLSDFLESGWYLKAGAK